MPMYTKSELLEHFDEVDRVFVDFSTMSTGGFIVVFFYDSRLQCLFRERYSKNQFRYFVLYQVFSQRHLIKESCMMSAYRFSRSSDILKFFFLNFLSLK